jgi:hypothetical protein
MCCLQLPSIEDGESTFMGGNGFSESCRSSSSGTISLLLLLLLLLLVLLLLLLLKGNIKIWIHELVATNIVAGNSSSIASRHQKHFPQNELFWN